MDLTIPAEDLALKRKAKDFAETILFPQEEALEMDGHLPPETLARLRNRSSNTGSPASTMRARMAARASPSSSRR